MNALNPNDILQMARKLGPRAAVMQMVNLQFQNNPQVQQLVQMAESGNTKDLSEFAQQYLGQQGIDLNQEINKMSGLSNK